MNAFLFNGNAFVLLHSFVSNYIEWKIEWTIGSWPYLLASVQIKQKLHKITIPFASFNYLVVASECISNILILNITYIVTIAFYLI